MLETKNKRVAFRIEPSVIQELNKNLDLPDETLSDLVRKILRDWVKKTNCKKEK